MSQENVETLQRIYESWERGDFTAGLSLFEPNVTLVIDPMTLDGGVFVGEGGVRRYMRRFLQAWESLTIAAESYTTAGDTILVKVTQTGIGEDSQVPVNQRYFQLWTFRGGRVVRLETILSEADALDAAGLAE
jgi:ketosteroid isomerase-like protein